VAILRIGFAGLSSEAIEFYFLLFCKSVIMGSNLHKLPGQSEGAMALRAAFHLNEFE
jgi:hypothetical protein